MTQYIKKNLKTTLMGVLTLLCLSLDLTQDAQKRGAVPVLTDLANDPAKIAVVTTAFGLIFAKDAGKADETPATE